MSPLAPLSFVDSQGFLVLVADGRPQAGMNHLDLRLDATHEHLGLMDAAGEFVDQVFYYPQTSEYSQGRKPDGAVGFAFSDLPTPGASNGGETSEVTVLLSFDWNTDWKFNASGQNLGTAWRSPSYNDTSWASGPGLLGNEEGALPEPLRTSFPIGDTTYYFRKTVTFDDIPDNMTTVFSSIIDDGMVVYVNGTEVQRVGMPNGGITAATLADRTVGQAAMEGPFTIPNSAWVSGENVIAVEVHQASLNSSDAVFGLQLTASATVVNPTDDMPEQLLHGLRITELMYHPANANLPEYLELQNTSDQELDLSGIRLSGGIDFTFPESTVLAPHEFIVVTDDVAAFVRAYGTAPNLAGQYAGKLSNGGEEIVLQFAAPLDTAILRFSYDPGWYPATDGAGSSLTVVDPGADYRRWNDAAGWTAATPSPGRDTGATVPGDINQDGIVDATDIDLLCAAIRANRTDVDLNGDGRLDAADMSYLLTDILGTTPGDANLDRVFNSSDLVQVFAAGQYEDQIAGNSGWADGDWNCDGEFTTSDLVTAFQTGGYVAGATLIARPLVNSNPIPRTADVPAVGWQIAAAVDPNRVTSTTDHGTVAQDRLTDSAAPTVCLASAPALPLHPAACDRVWAAPGDEDWLSPLDDAAST
jgi:hypothetical protein